MLHFGRMVDLARDQDEIKKDIPTPVAATAPVYPWGCCIRMDDEVLKKLGLDGDMPEVGDEIHFCCEARVTACSENECETTDGKKERRCNVELQIIRMSAPTVDADEEAEERTEARRGRLYGSVDMDRGK